MPTNSFPCPFCRQVFKSTGPFDKHLQARHCEQALRLYQPRLSLSKQLNELNEDQSADEADWPDLLQSLQNSNYNEIYEGTRDSDCESESAEESLLPPGEEGQIETFDGTGRSYGENGEDGAEVLATPWYPFQNATEFKLAPFFLQSGTP